LTYFQRKKLTVAADNHAFHLVLGFMLSFGNLKKWLLCIFMLLGTFLAVA
jgi:hypothetical protein